MNEVPRQPKMRATTQAAEGVPRLRWTLAEFERLGELGVLEDGDRVELVGGELVPMSPKGRRHEVVRGALHNWLRRNLSAAFDYHVEPGWRASVAHYLEPDFLIGTGGCNPTSIAAAEALLLIEVGQSSLHFDATTKAAVYAALGVREYWLVNAKTLEVVVHRDPSPDGYRSIHSVPPGEPVAAHLVTGLALSLGELPLD